MGDGDVHFFYVQYKNFPNNVVWEPQLFMLKYYRQQTRMYIKNKKRSHLDILLTAPNGIEGQRSFYRMEAGYIPRENDQFAPIQDISMELRQKINDIAAKKAVRLRKEASKQQFDDCDSKEDKMKSNKQQCDDENENDNFGIWTELSSDTSFLQQSNNNKLNDHSISFSFSMKLPNKKKKFALFADDEYETEVYDEDDDIKGDDDDKEHHNDDIFEGDDNENDDVIMTVDGHSIDGDYDENADSFGKAQSIFSQNTQGTASSSSMVSMPDNTKQSNDNSMDIDSVQPLSICMKTSNELECDSLINNKKKQSLLPPPPLLPMPIIK